MLFSCCQEPVCPGASYPHYKCLLLLDGSFLTRTPLYSVAELSSRKGSSKIFHYLEGKHLGSMHLEQGVPFVDASTTPQHNLAFLVETDVQGKISLFVSEDDIDNLTVFHLKEERIMVQWFIYLI